MNKKALLIFPVVLSAIYWVIGAVNPLWTEYGYIVNKEAFCLTEDLTKSKPEMGLMKNRNVKSQSVCGGDLAYYHYRVGTNQAFNRIR